MLQTSVGSKRQAPLCQKGAGEGEADPSHAYVSRVPGRRRPTSLLLLPELWPEASSQDGLFLHTHKASNQAETPLHRPSSKLQHVKSAAKEWLTCMAVCKCTGKNTNRGRNAAQTTPSALQPLKQPFSSAAGCH